MIRHLPQFPLNAKILTAGIYLFGLVALSLIIDSLVPRLAFAEAANKTRMTDTSPITIEATEFLEWNQNEGTYIAKGNAFVQQSESRINAANIIARYNAGGKTRNINHFIATGEVRTLKDKTPPKGISWIMT